MLASDLNEAKFRAVDSIQVLLLVYVSSLGNTPPIFISLRSEVDAMGDKLCEMNVLQL